MITETVPELPQYPKSNIIYISCLLFLFLVLASLPFIELDISIRSTAIIRPSAEVTTIHNISSGQVKYSFLFENKKVRKGDTLYILESQTLMEQEHFLKSRINFLVESISDLHLLIKFSTPEEGSNPLLIKSIYQQSYRTYQQKLSEAYTQLEKVNQDFVRQQKLYSEKVIARSEFETSQYELAKAKNEIERLKESQLSQWQTDLANLVEDKKKLTSEFSKILQEKTLLTVKASISGTLQNLHGTYPGSSIYANQELGQISPDTNLVAVAYVSPGDIGLLRKGMSVRIQVEAFNYNEWGFIAGKVDEVAQDIKIMNDQPVFEVRCAMDQGYLQLKNGYKGHLKKGMTLKTSFLITRRSLWKILYDRVDNWVNPNL